MTTFGLRTLAIRYPGEPASFRPALVLGPPSTFGAAFPFVTVIPLTSTRRGLSVHVEVAASELTGLDVTSYAQCELLRSVNKKRLMRRIGMIDPDLSSHVAHVVQMLLGY